MFSFIVFMDAKTLISLDVIWGIGEEGVYTFIHLYSKITKRPFTLFGSKANKNL